MCKIENHINNFYKKSSEGKECNRARGLERYFENEDKLSNQQKICYEKFREKLLLQKQNIRCIQFRDLVRSYLELENRLKVMEEKCEMNDSDINQIFYKRNLEHTTKKEKSHEQKVFIISITFGV